MIAYLDIMPNCIQCNNCIIICPENAICQDESSYIVNEWKCSLCSLCIEVCPDNAIKILERDDSDN